MDVTLNEIRELLKPSLSHSFVVGKKVTLYYTGLLVSVTDSDVVLEDAAWIADTGRFHDALKTGELNEVEPFVDQVIILRAGIIDLTEWQHDLPKVQK
jgi:hypothetical protein